MPLINIGKGTYINPDAITYLVELTSDEQSKMKPAHPYMVGFFGGDRLSIDQDAYDHLALGADESMLTAEQVAEIPPLSLSSQVAILLRDTYIGGATQDQLESILNLEQGELQAPLVVLMKEGIARADADADPPLFCHANHASYLVEALTICPVCAKPINMTGGYKLFNGEWAHTECANATEIDDPSTATAGHSTLNHSDGSEPKAGPTSDG